MLPVLAIDPFSCCCSGVLFLGWIVCLVNSAQNRQWWWFVLMLVLPPIAFAYPLVAWMVPIQPEREETDELRREVARLRREAREDD